MVCHPCQAEGNLSTEAYGRRVTGVGATYRERLKGPVACGECGELLAAGSLSIHLMTKHERAAVIERKWSTPTAGTRPQTYRMSFPAKGGPRKFPMAGCPGRVAMRTATQVHFVHRHVLDTVVILEEGKFPHPWCAQCDMLVPRRDLNRRNPGTSQYKKGEESNRRQLAEAETRESAERAFEAYGS